MRNVGGKKMKDGTKQRGRERGERRADKREREGEKKDMEEERKEDLIGSIRGRALSTR